MKADPIRYLVTAALLRADAPMRLEQIVEACGRTRAAVLNALWDLVAEGVVTEGQLVTDEPGPQYIWTARLKRKPRRITSLADARQRAQTDPSGWPQDMSIDSPLMRAFHRFVMRTYQPPEGKPFGVFFQCSMRRPFSKSSSHAFMRRAIEMATGFDPAREFDLCPAHVVVLASRIGPVPYELENLYPANVSSTGVKHFSDPLYDTVRPVLTRRMAEYLNRYASQYTHLAAFADDRYGQVMRDAADDAGVDLPIFPQPDGPRVRRFGESVPRTYWQKYWIQLCLHLMSLMGKKQHAAAEQRLADRAVEYD